MSLPNAIEVLKTMPTLISSFTIDRDKLVELLERLEKAEKDLDTANKMLDQLRMSLQKANLKANAFEEWVDKTNWVQKRKEYPFQNLGMHRADVMTQLIKHLESQLEKTNDL